MKTTKRFEDAVTKLYTAFHEGKLDAFDCSACAVGNMLDNEGSWGNYIGTFHFCSCPRYDTCHCFRIPDTNISSKASTCKKKRNSIWNNCRLCDQFCNEFHS